MFNLSLELATQYNLCRFVDRSSNERTSDKLRTNVLYFETKSSRYELARFTTENYEAAYRLSEVAQPYFKDEDFFNNEDQVPLLLEDGHLTRVIGEGLAWNDFLWGTDSVRVLSPDDQRNVLTEIGPILNFLFRPCKNVKNLNTS